jgi:hypothetical protein
MFCLQGCFVPLYNLSQDVLSQGYFDSECFVPKDVLFQDISSGYPHTPYRGNSSCPHTPLRGSSSCPQIPNKGSSSCPRLHSRVFPAGISYTGNTPPVVRILHTRAAPVASTLLIGQLQLPAYYTQGWLHTVVKVGRYSEIYAVV